MTAKLDLGFFGFSIIPVILLYLFIVATPYNEGFLTGCKKILAPLLILVQSLSCFV